MTRYTNFARKRTYVEAGFNNEPQEAKPESGGTESGNGDASVQATAEPDTKRRKRSRFKKAKLEESTTQGEGDEDSAENSRRPSKKFGDTNKKGKQFDKPYSKDANWRKLASEQRRMKRVDNRASDTVCFACREKGHTARDCRNTLAADVLDGEQQKAAPKSGCDAVGTCYRCGSRRHNLSRCKEPIDPSNPLPFASCFVCSGKGHLASQCPKNQSKGIYPNGGCCKLCKETTHLAKDCPMRKKEVAATTLFVGTGQEGGADEDDFHAFKRKTTEVDKTERADEKLKRNARVKVGAHTGVVKAFGDTQTPKRKKVVFF